MAFAKTGLVFAVEKMEMLQDREACVFDKDTVLPTGKNVLPNN